MSVRLTACLLFFASIASAETSNTCASIFFREHVSDDNVVVDFSNYQKLASIDKHLQNIRFRAHFDNLPVLKAIFPDVQVNQSSNSMGILRGELRFRIIGGRIKLFQVIDLKEVELTYPGGKNLEVESNNLNYADGAYETHIISLDLTEEDKGFFIVTLGAQDMIQAEVRAGDGSTYVVFFAYGLPENN